jgi:hypothetical protein
MNRSNKKLLCFLWLVSRKVGWRHPTVSAQRTTRELAQCLAAVVEVHCPQAEKIRVVWDHLSTHTPGALYEVCPPAEARRIL